MQLLIFAAAERPALASGSVQPAASSPAGDVSRVDHNPSHTPAGLQHRLLDAAFAALPGGAPFRTAGEAAGWGTEVTGYPYRPGGEWTLDHVYDALEGAANRYLATRLASAQLKERVALALDHETAWFRGRALTEHARSEAQFSTPLPIAQGAAWLARSFAYARTVLEPCGGTGSLISPLLDLNRVHVHANELDPRRRDVLKWLGFRPSDRDALKLPMERNRFDIVLSNPPFGAVTRYRGGRGATEFAMTNVAQRFAAAHLRSLRPQGLLIALMPGSTLDTAGADFRRWMGEHHTPLLYLACPEASYRSRGVLHDAMLVVARQGKGAEAKPAVVVRGCDWEAWTDAIAAIGSALSVEDVGHAETPQRLDVRSSLVAPPQQLPSTAAKPLPLPASSNAATEPGADPNSASEPRQAGLALDPEPGADGGAAAPPSPAQPAPAEEPGNDTPVTTPPSSAAAPDAGGALELDFATPVIPPRATVDWETHAREREQALGSPVFTPFNLSLRERRAPHPRLVVETRSMAGMPAPPLARQGFDSPLADDAWGRAGDFGGASDEQAELALRILDAWDQRHGFLCADDVGMGKSREIALLALEAIHNGETRILITTKNEDNLRNLEQELRRTASARTNGHFPAQFVHVGPIKEGKGESGVLPLPNGPTIYFAHAYNLADFARAIVGVHPTVWLADEAHEFANVADSNRGIAWTDIHEAMMRYSSRIAYFTATPAVTLNQLCYLYGLRLWPIGGFSAWLERTIGEGDSEKDLAKSETDAAAALQAHVDDAAKTGDATGLATGDGDGRRDYFRTDAFSIRTTPAEAEQVMRELRGSGHYMSRDLWRGGVTFDVEWIDLLGDREARQRYDKAAKLCRDISMAARQFDTMNERVTALGIERSMCQSYLKQVLFDLRLDRVLARADAALAEGDQVVISIHSVAGDDEGIESLGADDQEIAVNRRLEAAINRINVREIRKAMEDDCPVFHDLGDIPEALIARDELMTRAAALPRLRDPIRVIEQHFGASNVAAITGRVPARLRTTLMGEFQSGRREVAVMSTAGKIGLSYHDRNHRRRTLLVADYEWSATIFKQELGRVDRTGQFSAPRIALMASTASGERKFASTIAASMASLGATCKGSAESTGTDALEVFDMAGGIALEAMRNAVERMTDHARSYFTGSGFLELQVDTTGAAIFTPKRRPTTGTLMRQFLLELLLFPMNEANRTLALWEEEHAKLLTHQTIAALAARRTGRMRGEILRERALPLSRPLSLVDVRYEDGSSGVIAQGFVTAHMVRIQKARGPDTDGGPRTRRYVHLTSPESRLISGLELSTSEAHRVRAAFGVAGERDTSAPAILEDLKLGEKVAVRGNGAVWKLHLRRDGRIEIRGARLSRDRGTFMRGKLQGSIGYEAAGAFFYLSSHDVLATFLSYFPAEDGAEGTLAAAA